MRSIIACLFSITVAALLSSCASSSSFVERTFQKTMCDIHKSGVSQIEDTTKTMKEYGCVYGKKMNFFFLESSLTPNLIIGGNDLCHHVAYALCPISPSETYSAEIKRYVLFKGKTEVIFSSRKELDPGTWEIEVKIPIPKDAKAGVYAVRTVFQIGGNAYEKIDEFRVVPK
jgi:hypothetical protein